MSRSLFFSKSSITILFLAVIICANPINWIFQISNGLAIIVFISFCGITILNFSQLLHRINLQVVFFILYIYLFFLISLGMTDFNPQTFNYLLQFTILGVLPIIISSLTVSYNRFYYMIVSLGVFFIPFAINFNIDHYYSLFESDVWGFIMGVSYGLLRFVIAGMLVLFFYPPRKVLFKVLIYMEIAAIITFLALYGTRGAILSILLIFLLLLVLKKNPYFNYKTILILVLMAVLFYIIGFIFVDYIYPMLVKNDIHFVFIDKISSLSDKGDVSNGRKEIAQATIRAILAKPFFGYGIGSFDNYSGGYPHNLFLHFLYEGGILLCLPFIALLIRSFYIMLSNKYEFNYRMFLIFLFFSSFIELLFSSQPWISQIFWLYVGTVLFAKKMRRKQIIQYLY